MRGAAAPLALDRPILSTGLPTHDAPTRTNSHLHVAYRGWGGRLGRIGEAGFA
jgi:hypothetical protein